MTRVASVDKKKMFLARRSRRRCRYLRLFVGVLASQWLSSADRSLAMDSEPGLARANQSAQIAPTQPTLTLTLKQAVAIALEKDGNTKVQLAEQLIRQARSQSAQERATLLPNLDASVGQQSRTINLEALGIQFDVAIPGFEPPRFIGPFGTFDARVRATQALFDLSAVRRFQASKAGVSAAELQHETARNEVTALVAARYLAAVRADARLQAARANVELAQALLDLALSQKRVGTGVGIEVTRAEVQLANERQQLLLSEDERRRAHLELLRATGLPLETEVTVSQELAHRSIPIGSLVETIEIALNSRPDFRAQKKREERLKLQSSAAKWERLPSLHGFADYGSLGTSISNSLPTRSIGFSVTLPVFDGGRLDARRAETLSLSNQERIKSEDLREQIELEVRVSLDSLHSAEAQVKVAEEGLQLATAELEQAQRRYRSGITTSVEVTDAQTRLQRARENRISALFQLNSAQIELGQATGAIRTMVESGHFGD